MQNDALHAIFNEPHNLSYFVVVSNEFDNDLETINTIDRICGYVMSDLRSYQQCKIISKFNPNNFPDLPEQFLLEEDDEGFYDDVHPFTAKKTIATIGDSNLINARAISSPSTNIPNFQRQ